MNMDRVELKMQVLEKNTLKKLGLINTFSMIKYTKYYQKTGSFELKCALIKENTEILKDGNLIWIKDKVMGVIEYISKTQDKNMEMVVKGGLLGSLLSWRMVTPTIIVYDYPENVLKKVVEQNCKTGVKNYSKLTIGDIEVNNTTKISYQKTGGTVADEAETLCTTYNFGYDMEFISEDWDEATSDERYILFTIYKGKDRTLGNGTNKAVLLGSDFNNLTESEYTNDMSEFRNFALAAGEGEGVDRITLEVFIGDTEPLDMDRKEVYMDMRDIQSESEEVVISPTEYLSLLRQRANSKLSSDYNQKESYEAEAIENGGTFVFGEDYDIGDIVTIIDDELSIKINATVTGATFTGQRKGYTYEPIFGYETPTLYEKLRRGVLGSNG